MRKMKDFRGRTAKCKTLIGLKMLQKEIKKELEYQDYSLSDEDRLMNRIWQKMELSYCEEKIQQMTGK